MSNKNFVLLVVRSLKLRPVHHQHFFSHWISIREMVLPGPGFSPSSIEFKLAD